MSFRPKHSTVIAYLALAVAIVGFASSAVASTGVPNAGGLYNSGLIKLMNGQTKTIVKKGPFLIKASCSDGGAGSSTAQLTVKNTGTSAAVLESDGNAEYNAPTLAPGASRTGFLAESNSIKYFYGDYYNMFSAAAPGAAITGFGSVGWKVLGADCIFQLVLIG